MAAHKKQAIPLEFVDAIRSATVAATPNGSQDRILCRLDKWTAECGRAIRHRWTDKEAIKVRGGLTVATAEALKYVPDTSKHLSMLLTAGLVLVEEAWRQVPKDRRMPWLYLLHALRDMYLVMEPDWGEADSPEQKTGQALGEAMWQLAQ